MGKQFKDGSIISSYFDISAADSLQSQTNAGVKIVEGQVHKVHFIDEATNISKKYVEYDVLIREGYGTISTYTNIQLLQAFSGGNNYQELVLEPSDFAYTGKLEDANIAKNKRGTMVYVAFLDGNREKPFIVGSPLHSRHDGFTKEDGISFRSEFNGIYTEITKDGDVIKEYRGVLDAQGLPKNAVTPLRFIIGNDKQRETTPIGGHKVELTTESGKENLQILTANNQFFQISDQSGNESIVAVHKTGSLLDMSLDGSIKLVASNGNYLFLDAATGDISLVQENGNMFKVGEESTLGSSDGGKAITVKADGIEMISDKTVLAQASNQIIMDGGSFIAQDPIAKMKIENGLIAIGTPAAELLNLIDQTLIQLITVTNLLSTTLGNLGYPISTAASFPAITAQLTAIQVSLLTIKGTI